MSAEAQVAQQRALQEKKEKIKELAEKADKVAIAAERSLSKGDLAELYRELRELRELVTQLVFETEVAPESRLHSYAKIAKELARFIEDLVVAASKLEAGDYVGAVEQLWKYSQVWYTASGEIELEATVVSSAVLIAKFKVTKKGEVRGKVVAKPEELLNTADWALASLRSHLWAIRASL